MTPVVVIGVGNEFRMDDAAGLVVLDRLRRRLGEAPGWLALVESDGEPASMIDAWRGTELAIVVDAVRSGAPPGRTYRLEPGGREALGVMTVSSHGLGVGTAIGLARVLGLLPGRLIVRLIEAGDTFSGKGLNKAVSAATEEVTSAILDDLGMGSGGG